VRPRTLLVLLALVVGLGLFIRFYEHDLPSSDERTERAKKILEFKKDEVTAVTLDANGTVVRLERVKAAPSATGAKPGSPAAAAAPQSLQTSQTAEWRLTRPRTARADSAAVDRLLDSLAAVEKTRTLDQVDKAAVGLDKPRGVARLDTPGGAIVLSVGARVPTGGELIAAVSGTPGAYVVSDGLWNEFLHKPDDWRDHHMFSGQRDQIERISFAGPAAGAGAAGGAAAAPRLLLARRGERFWIESPFADRADRDKVDKLLDDLTGLTAEKFVDGLPAAAAELGLASPHATLEVLLAGKPQPVRIELGASRTEAASPAAPGAPTPPSGPAGQPPPAAGSTFTWARAGGQTFEAHTSLAEAVDRAPEAWRSPLLSGLEVHQVDAVTVRDATAASGFTRSGPDWKRGAETISYLPVSELLFALVETKADRFLAADEARAAVPVTAKPTLVFDLKSSAGNETISLYPAVGGPATSAGAAGGVPARVSGREPVLMLPAGKLGELADKLAAARTAKPLPAAKPAARNN
jgi:hypothetical protein